MPKAGRFKDLVRRASYRALQGAGVVALRRARRVSRGEGWAAILVFHRVTDGAPEDGITVSPRRFRSILGLLRDHYRVIALDDLVNRLRGGLPFSGRDVCITFDDGYLDNFAVAAPILAEFRMPATFFLTAGFIGSDKPFPWDEAKGVDGPLMSWDQAAEMGRHGFDLGCHTWSHPNLGQEPVSSAQRELVDARAFMEDKLARPVRHFAYPFGARANITPAWVEAARTAGFSSLSCGFGGLVTVRDDPFWIPRMGSSHQRSLTELRIEMDDAW